MSNREQITSVSLLLGGALFFYAARELYIESGVSKVPTTVTLSELENGHIPDNRHLVVTGPFQFSKRLEYWEKRTTDTNRRVDDYYYPVTQNGNSKPRVFFRTPTSRKDLQDRLLKGDRVECIRILQIDVPAGVFEKFSEAFKGDVAEEAIILDMGRTLGQGTFMFWAVGPLGLSMLTFSVLSLCMRPLPFRYASTVTKTHRIVQVILWVGIVAFFFFGDSVLASSAREGMGIVIVMVAALGSLFLLIAAQSIQTCLIEERPLN